MTNPVTGITLDQYVIPVDSTFGDETFVDDFGLSSFQACVSTVTSGLRDGVVGASAITTPAYLAQCDFLEAVGVISSVRLLRGVSGGQPR